MDINKFLDSLVAARDSHTLRYNFIQLSIPFSILTSSFFISIKSIVSFPCIPVNGSKVVQMFAIVFFATHTCQWF